MTYMEMRKEILDLKLVIREVTVVLVDLTSDQGNNNGVGVTREALSHSPFPLAAALVIQILLDLVWMIFLETFLVILAVHLGLNHLNLGPRVPPKVLRP